MALSGRVADGTILAEFSSPAYVSWALEKIERGVQEVGHGRNHRLTVFAFACVDSHTAAARGQLRPLIASAIASDGIDAQLAPLGILPLAQEFLNNGGQERLEAGMPESWIDQLTVTGTHKECRIAFGRLIEAGAETVVLVPLPGKGLDELDVFAHHFMR